MKTQIPTRLLSVFLALLILFSSVPASSAAEAVEEIPSVPDSTITESPGIRDIPVLDEASVPQIVGVENAHARDHVLRMHDEEADELNKLVFLNSDGSRTMYLYDHPVKYVDEHGDVQDISLDIANTSDPHEPFRSAAAGAVTRFSSDLSSGIRLTGNGTDLRLVPEAPDSTARNPQRLDSGTVSYPYDQHTSIEYSLTYTGFKEDIVVSQYTGQTEYSFTLYTNGLTLTEMDGSWYLTDGEDNIQATIGDIIIFTADERNNTLGQLEAETVRANEEYNLTIVLDPEYLADPKTAYPIRIDPTIELYYEQDSAGAIVDLTVCSAGTQSGSSGSLYIGKKENYGTCRALMKFPGLDLSDVENGEITSAKLELRDLLCESAEQDIECYVFNGNEWTESSTWSSAGAGSLGAHLDTVTFGYEIGVEFESKHRYDFDITDAVQSWVSDATAKSKGIIFKATNALESGSANTYRTIASYNRSSNKPSLSVTYVSGLGALNHTSIDVDEGSTVALHVSGISAQITWSSSNSSIATVNSNGVVTGVRAGQVTITASAAGYTPKTCIVYVTIPDGVYRIKNNYSNLYLGVSDSSTTSGAAVTQQSVQNEGAAYLSQLWNISYIGDGYYTFTPMHKLNYGLYLNSTSVVSSSIGFNTSLATTHVLARWRVRYSSNGYILQCINGITYTIAPTGYTSAVDAAITAHSTLSSATAYRWTLSKVKGVFLYEPYSYVGIPSDSTVDMEFGTSAVFADALVSGGSSVSWSVSNPYNASINSSTRQFTAQKRGHYIITASTLINGDIYQACLNVNVKETIYIISLYDSSLSENSSTLGLIDDAVNFLNVIYSDSLYLNFEPEGTPTLFDPFSDCTYWTIGACAQKCYTASNCVNHHQNIDRIGRNLYDSFINKESYENDHIVVLWTDHNADTFCDYDPNFPTVHKTISDGTYAFAYTDFVNNLSYPSITFFAIDRLFENEDNRYQKTQAFMSLYLAHEVAHTLGLAELYQGAYAEEIEAYFLDREDNPGNIHTLISTDKFCLMQGFGHNDAYTWYSEIDSDESWLCEFCAHKLAEITSNVDLYEEPLPYVE